MGVQENVDIKATADTNAALSALQQINANLEKLAATGGKTQEKMDGMFGAFAQAGKVAAGMVGIGSAIGVATTAMSMFNAEWDNYIRKQRAAAEAQISVADAQRRFAGTLGNRPVDPESNRVMSIAAKYAIQRNVAFLAAENVQGSLGTLQPEQGYEALEAVAAYRPGPLTGASELSAMAQSINSLRKQDGRITAPGGMAFIRSVMQASRVNEIEPLTTHLMPQIVNASAFGSNKDSLKYLASLAIGIGDAADDPSGRKTGTGMFGFLKQIKAVTSDHIGADASVEDQLKFLHNTEEGTRIRKKLLGPMFGQGADKLSSLGGGDLSDLADRMAGVDSKILLHGEAKVWMPLIQLLQNGGNRTKEAMSAAWDKLSDPTDPRAIAEMQAAESELNRSPMQQTAVNQRILNAGTARMQGGNQFAIAGMRDELQKGLMAAGVPKIKQDALLANFDLQTATATTTGQVIGAEMDVIGSAIEKQRKYDSESVGEGIVVSTPARRLSEEQLRTNEILTEMLEALKNQKITVDLGNGPTERGQLSAPQRAGQQ